ncbi:MAG: LptF/LptG family permease [Planctomycetota bacterium]
MTRLARRRLALFGTLDRYVGRVFLGAYLLAALLVVGLFLVVDLAGNLDEYLKPASDGTPTPATKVLRYYVLHLPFLYLQVAPFVTLIAGLFTVSRLQKSREIVAALSAGVSARRLLAPLFGAGLLLTTGTIALREYASSTIGFEVGVMHVELEEHLSTLVLEGVRFKDLEGEMIQLDRFWPADPDTIEELGPWDRRAPRAARFAGLTAVRDEGGRWLSYRVGTGRHDDDADTWRLRDGQLVEVDSDGRADTQLATLSGRLDFEPAEVWRAWKGRNTPLDLSLREARALARRDPQNIQYRTLSTYLLTFPFANMLLLVGPPFPLQYERGAGTEGSRRALLCVGNKDRFRVTPNLGMQGHIGPVRVRTRWSSSGASASCSPGRWT